jgi:hypothetical protein
MSNEIKTAHWSLRLKKEIPKQEAEAIQLYDNCRKYFIDGAVDKRGRLVEHRGNWNTLTVKVAEVRRNDEPEPEKQRCYTDYGSLLPRADDMTNALRDIRENILVEERLSKYKGVYSHYGEASINNTAFGVPVLNKSLIPVYAPAVKPAGQNWAQGQSRDGPLAACFTSGHATEAEAADCRHAGRHEEMDQPKANNNKRNAPVSQAEFKKIIDEESNLYEKVADKFGAECETPRLFNMMNVTQLRISKLY